jgi:hypothetical protein
MGSNGFAVRYARRVERQVVACLEEYTDSLNVKVYRAVRPHRSFQSASVAVMQRRRFTWLGIFYEVMTLEIRYHVDSPQLDRVDAGEPI